MSKKAKIDKFYSPNFVKPDPALSPADYPLFAAEEAKHQCAERGAWLILRKKEVDRRAWDTKREIRSYLTKLGFQIVGEDQHFYEVIPPTGWERGIRERPATYGLITIINTRIDMYSSDDHEMTMDYHGSKPEDWGIGLLYVTDHKEYDE